MAKGSVDLFGNIRTAALTVGLTAVCFGFIVFRQVLTGEVRFLFLLWNLFLAWLPYLFSTAAVWTEGLASRGGAKLLMLVLFGVPWLLLYPNAPYVTTDFIHLVANKTLYISNGEISFLFWYDLVLVFFFSWCGLFLGYLSTLQLHQAVNRLAGKITGWLFVVTVSLLGGYGIFLGRVVRLNSWDVVYNPFRLLLGIMENLHRNGFLFSCLFAFFLLVVYVFLYSLHDIKREKGNTMVHT